MTLHLLHLKKVPILEQLRLEEALLRQDKRNWCIINEGSSDAIVMGISGKVEELVDDAKIKAQPIPIIKRFSGGGTVVVDENTLFVTFIFQKDQHDFSPFPEPIMKWSEGIYRPVFDHSAFALRENDYVLGEKKCGGNAQYIKKDRWLHHTSFLWDYHKEKMQYLLLPKKTPPYRQGRPHEEFLCRLCDHFPSKEAFTEKLKALLHQRYLIQPKALKDLEEARPHRQATALLTTISNVIQSKCSPPAFGAK